MALVRPILISMSTYANLHSQAEGVHKSLSTPPAHLKIEDMRRLPRARRAASEPPIGSPVAVRTQVDPAVAAAAPPLAAPPVTTAPPAMFPAVPMSAPVHTVPHNPYSIPPYNPHVFPHPQYPYSASTYPHYGLYPSFPPPTALSGHVRYSLEPEDTPTNYPLIADWLKKLDSGSRSDGLDFAQFGEPLHQNGYTRLNQLADEYYREKGPRELTELCPGMTLGLAKLVLKYAANDCQEIKGRRSLLGSHI
jgi:hypothetical protein